MSIIEDYKLKTASSALWSHRAKETMPDGVTADTRIFNPHGLYISRAEGVYKTDLDGNDYMDFFGGHGALVFGHNYPKINRAVSEALKNGIQYAASHPLEVRWGELIKQNFPSIEKVRFVASGTEATLLAMRIARAYTKREKIVRISTHYHGWHDFSVSGYASNFDGSPAPGVIENIAENTILIKPDDFNSLSQAFDDHGDDIAAIIAEPVGSHFGVIPVSDEFLITSEILARKFGALFILDEVISGFRVGNNGMQGLLDLKPDLTCLAKAAAGGMPGGIVGGRDEIMSVLLKAHPNKVLHQGTFTGNPITAAAAITAIEETVELNVCDYISELGFYAREKMNSLFESKNMKWQAYGRFSSFHLMPGLSPGVKDYSAITKGEISKPSIEFLSLLRMGLLVEGVDIGGRGSIFLSYQHNKEHIDHLVKTFSHVIDRINEEGKMIFMK